MLLKGNGQGYEPGVGGFFSLLTPPTPVYSSKKGVIECKVRYSFLIPKETIDSSKLDFDNLYIGLYPDWVSSAEDNITDFAAICKLELSRNVSNVTLAVDWELSISNI